MSAMKTLLSRWLRGLLAAASAALLSGLVALPAPAADLPSKAGIDAVLKNGRSQAQPEFLPVDEAFQPSVVADGPDKIRVEWLIHDGYYLYKSRIKVATTSQNAQLGEVALPTGIKKTDEYFGEQEIYHDSVAASVPVARKASSGSLELPVDVTYQGCAEAGLCYPPTTRHLTATLPGVAAAAATSAGGGAAVEYESEQGFFIRLLKTGSLAAVMAGFFIAGLGLSFTPCVLPMVPILSGLIVGQGSNVTPVKGFSLAFTYVQGLSLTYAGAGAIAAIFFGQAPQGFFQQPWIIATFALLFVALAFAMFGAFTLQMPSALQTRLTNFSNNQKTGSYIGVLIMGALSALIATACVAPALVGALTVLGQIGDVPRGALALYALGFGMGAPLLLVGASAGSLLPKAGAWMDTVKAVFGVMFLALALYFAQQLVPALVGMFLWSALAVIAGFWIFSLKGPKGTPAPAGVRAPGLMMIVYGVLLLIGVASGSTDPLQPLSGLRLAAAGAPLTAPAPVATSTSSVVATSSAPTEAPHVIGSLSFETIKSVDDLNARVAAASAAGKTVLLDFYADWCTSCKEMEKYTFTDASVQSALSNTVLLRADVTRNDKLDQVLMQHFGIFGPPTIALYDSKGIEQSTFRVVGYMKAGQFTSVVRKAFGDQTSS